MHDHHPLSQPRDQVKRVLALRLSPGFIGFEVCRAESPLEPVAPYLIHAVTYFRLAVLTPSDSNEVLVGPCDRLSLAQGGVVGRRSEYPVEYQRDCVISLSLFMFRAVAYFNEVGLQAVLGGLERQFTEVSLPRVGECSLQFLGVIVRSQGSVGVRLAGLIPFRDGYLLHHLSALGEWVGHLHFVEV